MNEYLIRYYLLVGDEKIRSNSFINADDECSAIAKLLRILLHKDISHAYETIEIISIQSVNKSNDVNTMRSLIEKLKSGKNIYIRDFYYPALKKDSEKLKFIIPIKKSHKNIRLVVYYLSKINVTGYNINDGSCIFKIHLTPEKQEDEMLEDIVIFSSELGEALKTERIILL